MEGQRNGSDRRTRREIATEMSEGEVAAAQRAARDWLQAHQPGHCRQAA